MKIALTGGIACGKSLLARYLSQMGVRIIDADDVVHELEAPGGEAVAPIVERFGTGVLAPDGGIDRQRLASVVFGNAAESPVGRAVSPKPPQRRVVDNAPCQECVAPMAARADLESILFPMVRRRISDFIDADIRQPTIDFPTSDVRLPGIRFSLVIIPLLFESHWETEYDIIVSLVSEHEVQIRRMAETRGMSREQAEARIAAQMPVAEKAVRADYVIENNSTPEALHAEAVRLVDWLKSKIRG